MGLTGVWLGLYSGLFMASALLYLRFRHLANGYADNVPAEQENLFNNVLKLESQ
jgi:Na+-driven multidrug efflux pump